MKYKVYRKNETTGQEIELIVEEFEEAIALIEKFRQEDSESGTVSGLSVSRTDYELSDFANFKKNIEK